MVVASAGFKNRLGVSGSDLTATSGGWRRRNKVEYAESLRSPCQASPLFHGNRPRACKITYPNARILGTMLVLPAGATPIPVALGVAFVRLLILYRARKV